jgi:hypothetical protein
MNMMQINADKITMLEQMSGWWFLGGAVVLAILALYLGIKSDNRNRKAYHDSVKRAVSIEMYDEEIVDWHFYEDHHETTAAEDCREAWAIGRN